MSPSGRSIACQRFQADFALQTFATALPSRRARAAPEPASRVVELIPVRLEGYELSQNSAAAPRGPAPGGGPARSAGAYVTSKDRVVQQTIMLSGRSCHRDAVGAGATELVRIPLEPEEREQPERDGESRQHRQIRAHARTADPRIY